MTTERKYIDFEVTIADSQTVNHYLDYLTIKPGVNLNIEGDCKDYSISDLARNYENPFCLWPVREQLGHTSRFREENNLPQHLFQIVGGRINCDKKSTIQTWSVHSQPQWTTIRDKAIYLNVGDLNACWAGAEAIQAAWTDETLILDATTFQHEREVGVAYPCYLDWDLAEHNPVKLESFNDLICDQDDLLIERILQEIHPVSAMKFMGLDIDEFNSKGLLKASNNAGGRYVEDYIFKGVPNWYIKAYFLNKGLSDFIQRNFKHIVIVGAAKAIGQGDFKPSKLFQYLAALGRRDTMVVFLD